MSVLENKLCLSRGRTLNSRLSSQILNLMLVAFVLLHLVKIRCSKHIICETGTTVEHTSHTVFHSVFKTPGERWTFQIECDNASRKKSSTVK